MGSVYSLALSYHEAFHVSEVTEFERQCDMKQMKIEERKREKRERELMAREDKVTNPPLPLSAIVPSSLG